MSKTDTKAGSRFTPPIGNRMIPRFRQWPDGTAGSFAADMDTKHTPPRCQITHRASHSDQQGPSRRRKDESTRSAPENRG